jgi:hypothetical protein
MEPTYKGTSWLNRQVGKYTIVGVGDRVKYPSQKDSIQMWKVKCACGKEKQISKWHLIYGNTTGCSDCVGERNRFEKSPNWNSTAKNVTGMYFAKIKKCAEKRNIPFEINREELDFLFQKQDGRCRYTKMELVFESSGCKGTASLDRIDSSLGYTKDNVQWVHKDVNTIKWDLSHDQFVKLCKTITENFE